MGDAVPFAIGTKKGDPNGPPFVYVSSRRDQKFA
jgi:hypothetical protein